MKGMAMLENDDIREILDTSDRLIASTETTLHRYLYREIDWSGRLICLKGARGKSIATTPI